MIWLKGLQEAAGCCQLQQKQAGLQDLLALFPHKCTWCLCGPPPRFQACALGRSLHKQVGFRTGETWKGHHPLTLRGRKLVMGESRQSGCGHLQTEGTDEFHQEPWPPHPPQRISSALDSRPAQVPRWGSKHPPWKQVWHRNATRPETGGGQGCLLCV